MTLRAAGTLLAALAMPGAVQARCVVWNALNSSSDDTLRNLAVRFDGRGGLELTYLGVADAFREADDCEMSTDAGEFSIDCGWTVADHAEAERKVGSIQRDIENCLGVVMEQQPDFQSSGSGSAMLLQRELDLVRGNTESTISLTLLTYGDEDRLGYGTLRFAFERTGD